MSNYLLYGVTYGLERKLAEIMRNYEQSKGCKRCALDGQLQRMVTLLTLNTLLLSYDSRCCKIHLVLKLNDLPELEIPSHKVVGKIDKLMHPNIDKASICR